MNENSHSDKLQLILLIIHRHEQQRLDRTVIVLLLASFKFDLLYFHSDKKYLSVNSELKFKSQGLACTHMEGPSTFLAHLRKLLSNFY